MLVSTISSASFSTASAALSRGVRGNAMRPVKISIGKRKGE